MPRKVSQIGNPDSIMWLRFIAVIAALALHSCSPSVNYGDAKNATNTFHHLFDSGQYAAIYGRATEGFQKSASRDQFIGFLSRINRKMGRCGEVFIVEPGGYRSRGSDTFVITTSTGTCINGKFDERFVWQMIEGKAVLFEYSANSPLFLTD